MSLGKRIRRIRLQANKTQQQLCNMSGLAVSYLSRLENGRITPSIRTLSRISKALGVPLTSFFEGEPVLEPGDQCPVSPSGRCILDQLFVGRGQRSRRGLESYSLQQLEALRMCNILLQTGNREIVASLCTLIKSLLALASSKEDSRLKEILDATHFVRK